MPTLASSAVPCTRQWIVRQRQLVMLACFTGLLLPACSHEGDEANQQGNGTEATRASTSTAAPASSPVVDGSIDSQLAAKRRSLVAEAVSALQETYAALGLLANGNAAEATKALARATGKLDVVLAADPQLALAPVDVRVTTHDVITTPAAVKALRERAEAALDAGRLQDARYLIGDLASEHVISVASTPLATYPDAIKQAAALIHNGKAAEAVAALEAALSTLVIEKTVIPLPLARAEALLVRARPLAEKPQRSVAEDGRLRALLAQARVQLDLARALGYATKDDLDALSDALKTIEQKTEGQGSSKGLFDRFKTLFGVANTHANTRPSS